MALQVVEAKVVMDRAKGPRGAPLKLAECIVGDETGSIVFTAKNEQGSHCGCPLLLLWPDLLIVLVLQWIWRSLAST